MDYEKKYKEALERMKSWARGEHPECFTEAQAAAEFIFPELKESEDERIRKELLEHCKNQAKPYILTGNKCPQIQSWIAWLEKQGEHKRFRDFIQIGDKVTRNESGELVNLSQLERIAKPRRTKPVDKVELEKQGEKPQGKSALEAIKEEKVDNQNCIEPADKVKPKFKHGDRVKNKKSGVTQILGSCIEDVYEGAFPFRIKEQDNWELVEQKPSNKVEPKFHVGEWITDGNITIQIEAIKNDCYLYCGDCTLYSTKTADKVYHLWTIQDAKDGDILIYNNSIFIYNEVYEKHLIYYGIYGHNKFHDDKYYSFIDLDTIDVNNIHPATKEQRDTLIKAMAGAGYEWDAERNELKRIVVPIFNIGDTIAKKHNSDIHDFGSFTITNITGGKYWYNDRIICNITEQDEWEIYEHVRQKPVWSEEDDNCLSIIIAEFSKCAGKSVSKDKWMHCNDFLNSLKNRVQPKVEWSEEDEDMLYKATLVINRLCAEGKEYVWSINTLKKLFYWLKSLRLQNNITDEELAQAKKNAYNDALDKIEYQSGEPTFDDGWSAAIWYLKKRNTMPQLQWKPSDGQINSITWAVRQMKESACYDSELVSLYKDLKKLREE